MIKSFKSKETKALAKTRKNIIHPGEILLEEFLRPMNISQTKLSIEILVPAPRINAIVNGTRSISADTALRLGKYFGTGPEFWMNLQTNYDLCIAAKNKMLNLNKIPQYKSA